MQTICGFKMRNNGGFDCASKVQYIDPNGSQSLSDRWDFIPIGQEQMVYPKDKNVPDGSMIMLYFDIALGSDRTAGTYFLYDVNAGQYAEYDITGTTLHSNVHFDGLKNN